MSISLENACENEGSSLRPRGKQVFHACFRRERLCAVVCNFAGLQACFNVSIPIKACSLSQDAARLSRVSQLTALRGHLRVRLKPGVPT